MPRPRPPYLHRYRTRYGHFIWYVRKPRGHRIRIRGEFGSPGFMEAYRLAMDGLALPGTRRKPANGSLEWLWERYRETDAWRSLAAATRRQRENIMSHVLRLSGTESCEASRRDIVAGRDRRSGTPSQARNFLDCMRGLYGWAFDAGHVEENPALGVKNPLRPKGGGFPAWSEDEVDRYHARWPIGTKERVWIDVLLYTGLRRGDAVRLGRQHVRSGVASIRTEKSREEVTVTLPILPVLERTLKAGPCGELAFICGETGKPLTKESFGNMFREACRKARVSKSAHGLRKAGATRAAENGATVAELEAIFGWRGGSMASLYTRAADRARLARGAISKLERNAG